jgi:hypothetical protein
VDDNTKQLIKYGAMAAAAWFVYDWLQSSGLWAQWFGTTAAAASNSFNNSASLIAYCQANPSGTAVYIDPATGQSSIATCAQWIASNPAVAASTPTSTASAPQSQAIAAMQAANGSDSATLDVWSYYWQNNPTFSGAPSGYGVNGSISATQFNQILGLNGGNREATVSAEQFVAWVNQTSSGGISGYMIVAGDDPMADFYPDPNAWVN